MNNLNHSFFSNSTSESYYFAGYLLADGSVGQTGVTWTCHIQDVCAHEAFVSSIGLTPERIKITNYILSDGITVNQKSTVYVPSRKIVYDLKKFGIIPNKTYNHIDPIIDDRFFPAFLTGFIDGDGCIVKRGKSHITRISKVNLTGNRLLMRWFSSKINELYNISGTIVDRGVWAHLIYYGKSRDIILKECLNNYSGFRLERKWGPARAHLANWNRTGYPSDLEDFIVSSYLGGSSIPEILRKYTGSIPIGEKGIRRTLKKHNVVIRGLSEAFRLSRRVDPQDPTVGSVVDLYLRGFGCLSIQKLLGVDQKRVKRILTQLGIPLRTRSEAKKAALRATTAACDM